MVMFQDTAISQREQLIRQKRCEKIQKGAFWTISVKPFRKAASEYQPIWHTWSTFFARLKSFDGTDLCVLHYQSGLYCARPGLTFRFQRERRRSSSVSWKRFKKGHMMLQSDTAPVQPFSEGRKNYQPIWPSLCTFGARLKTFAGTHHWSRAMVRQLAAAGFFYTGHSDTVRCFYCSLALEKWEDTDDPLQEHERHEDQCDYFVENFAPLPCVYAAEIVNPCGHLDTCAFCKWEEIARKQLLEDDQLGINLTETV